MLKNASQTSPLTQRTLIDIDINSSNERNNSQRSNSEFSKLFRDIFHRSTKRKTLQIEKEMTNLSTTLMKSDETRETLASVTDNNNAHVICLFSDSPHYIVRV